MSGNGYGGYMGKILRVNLTNRSTKEEPLDFKMAEMFLGGTGLGSKILSDEVDPKVDPLSPANKLIFATGALTGTRAPCSGRYALVFKSPSSGSICDSHSGGDFPAEIKFAGYDVIIVEGASAAPVYLWINDGKVEFRDAKHLWGKNVYDTTDTIESELGDKKVKVACIGRAGEKLSNVACVMNDKARAAGRGGGGAVMGSKKLKAIAIRGSQKPKMANEQAFAEFVKETVTGLREFEHLNGLRELGTASFVNPLNAFGVLPTKNFQFGQFEKAELVSGEAMKERYLKKRTACYACPLACGRYCVVDEEPYKLDAEVIEYEGLNAFGACCGNSDIRAALKCGDVCNDYGMDFIGAGTTICYAFELYQRGFISDKDTNGLKLEWGNALGMLKLLTMMGEREGIGDLLAQGSLKTSKKFGPEAEKFAIQVKGLESAMHEPRGYKSLGLLYATSTIGASHIRPYPGVWEVFGVPFTELDLPAAPDRFSEQGKAKATKTMQDFANFVNALDICQFVFIFPVIQLSQAVKLLNAATGFNFTSADALKVGERIQNIQRQYLAKVGYGRDTLPWRFTHEPMPEGPCAGQVVNLEPMLDEYYELRGWDKNGVPGLAKIKELGLA